MADYVPFPTKDDEVETDRGLTKKVLGCFGCGGLGVAAFFGVLVLLIGSLGTGASGCDIDLDGDPGKGTASQRLPVTVSPATDLDDGTVVRITSDAFEPSSIVGVAVCLRSADTEQQGADACDEVQGARYATDADGRLDATYPVPRVITLGRVAFDCASAPEHCLVVAADAGNYDESGGQPITFRSGLPTADLTPGGARPTSDHLPIGASPPLAGPVVVGTTLDVLATGFQPGEPLLIAYCTNQLEALGVIETCEPLNAADAVSAVMLRKVDGDFPTANDEGAYSTSLEAWATVTPYGDDLGKALSEASATTTTTTATNTTTTRPGVTTTVPPLDEGEVRCTQAAGGCIIVIAAAADTKRSATLPYVVAS